MMYLKVLKNKKTMNKEGWFPIQTSDAEYDILGPNAYAKEIDIIEEINEKIIEKINEKIKKGK